MIRTPVWQQGRELTFVTLFLRIPAATGRAFADAMQDSVENFGRAVRSVLEADE